MLKKLELKNYKCWKDVSIDFGRVTTFVGTNSGGKSSATIYPLEAVLTNGNLPVELITYNEDELSIKVELDDSSYIRRTRNEMGSTLQTSEDGKLYSGKKNLDGMISRVSKISRVDIDESGKPENLNFIHAESSLFLVGKSSEVVRRRLSGIFQLNSLEAARSKKSAELKQLLFRKDEVESLINSKTETINSLKEKINLLELIEEKRNILELLLSFRDLKITYPPQIGILQLLLLQIQYIQLRTQPCPKIPVWWEKLLQYLSVEDESLLDLEKIETEIQGIEKILSEVNLCPTCMSPISLKAEENQMGI